MELNRLPIHIALFALFISGNNLCDLVTSLDPLGTPTSFENQIYSLDWCGCDFLSVAGTDQTNGIIRVYSFDQEINTFETVGTSTLIGEIVKKIAWCGNCEFLAAYGDDGDNDFIQIYSFDPVSGLVRVVPTKIFDGGIGDLDWCTCNFLATTAFIQNEHFEFLIQIYSFNPTNYNFDLVTAYTSELVHYGSIKWCSDCRFLAAGSDILSIFSFDPDNPGDLILSETIDFKVDADDRGIGSLDWCGECEFIAAGGSYTIDGSSTGLINIYQFNREGPTLLSLVASVTMPSRIVELQWCGCENLAVISVMGGAEESYLLQLYRFDGSTTLSLLQTNTLQDIPASFGWCGNCDYVVVGENEGFLELFKSTKQTEINAPTNLVAQKIWHRFPTQIDIINKLCWNAVTNAVSYKVYADATLATLLATITAAPYCYSQHQIRKGKLSTYYVTAVDADGNESDPASVTI